MKKKPSPSKAHPRVQVKDIKRQYVITVISIVAIVVLFVFLLYGKALVGKAFFTEGVNTAGIRSVTPVAGQPFSLTVAANIDTARTVAVGFVLNLPEGISCDGITITSSLPWEAGITDQTSELNAIRGLDAWSALTIPNPQRAECVPSTGGGVPAKINFQSTTLDWTDARTGIFDIATITFPGLSAGDYIFTFDSFEVINVDDADADVITDGESVTITIAAPTAENICDAAHLDLCMDEPQCEAVAGLVWWGSACHTEAQCTANDNCDSNFGCDDSECVACSALTLSTCDTEAECTYVVDGSGSSVLYWYDEACHIEAEPLPPSCSSTTPETAAVCSQEECTGTNLWWYNNLCYNIAQCSPDTACTVTGDICQAGVCTVPGCSSANLDRCTQENACENEEVGAHWDTKGTISVDSDDVCVECFVEAHCNDNQNCVANECVDITLAPTQFQPQGGSIQSYSQFQAGKQIEAQELSRDGTIYQTQLTATEETRLSQSFTVYTALLDAEGRVLVFEIRNIIGGMDQGEVLNLRVDAGSAAVARKKVIILDTFDPSKWTVHLNQPLEVSYLPPPAPFVVEAPSTAITIVNGGGE